MKYLKVFETEALQDEFIESGDYLQPHVSCLEDGSKVKYNIYSKEYYKMLNVPLTFEALGDNTEIIFYQFDIAYSEGLPLLQIEISTDNGNTWVAKYAERYDTQGPMSATVTLNAGEKVLVRGNNEAYGYYSDSEGEAISNCGFFADSDCYVYGNIMSLIDKNNFSTLREVTDYAFSYLFSDYNDSLDGCWLLSHSEKKLLLPATTLADSCYANMFRGCTSLTIAPELPATTLSNYCYYYMFCECTGLTTAPKLPATTLASNCYTNMFAICTSLTSAPALPATTLASNCYASMFQGCTGLTTPPELPATTLMRYCYHGMFSFCTGLTSAPELPVTTLAESCYGFMFHDCSSLTSAPVLPATTLVDSCYRNMFQGCTNLSYIKAMFTTTPSDSYTYNWVKNVNATGTFVKNYKANWNVTGDNGIPTGWTVETYADGIIQ